MVNYYHRFIPHAADFLAPLNDILKGTKKLSKKPLEWTQEAVAAFSSIKTSLADVALLAHPVPNAATILTTDASSEAVGAVLQQDINGVVTPIAFFSKRLDPRQQNYSAFDWELVAIYEAVRHFQHLLEARVSQQLEYVSKYRTDIRHIKGEETAVADTCLVP